MSEPRLDDGAWRERIKAALGENLLVEAGAGSGKTHELATRMAGGVASGAYIVEHMAAVTFTRKAAAELRGRFQLALERELKHSVGDAAVTARVSAALSNLERFFAGTIHSFCAQLLRERPVEAGVSPGFTEFDQVEDALRRVESWRDFRTAAKAAGDPVMLDLLETGIKPADLDSAFATVCLYEEVDFPPGDGVAPDPAPVWKALDTFWAAIRTRLPNRIDPKTTCPIQKKARRFFGMMRVAGLRRDRPAELASLVGHWDFAFDHITQKFWSDDPAQKKQLKAEIQQLHDDFRVETVAPYKTRWRQYIYRLAIALLVRARTHAAEERQRLNALNYGDLLQRAARVLRENATVRRALGQKYRWLFVDEFQDTDPVQAEIMFLLASLAEAKGGRPAHPADWRRVALRPGALFVVGDPKQSIYRFRRADIDIYNEVRERLAHEGGVVPLTTNFRSVRRLCEWANGVFGAQFPADPTIHSPRFAPLTPKPSAPEGAGSIVTLTIPEGVEKKNVPTEEAERIARYIRAEVDAKRRGWGDFLLLTRKRAHLGVYSAALEALRIPLEVSGAGAFGDSEEVRGLALLLRSLADPQDGVALVGVLRGPLFGLSDRALFAYRQAGGWFSLVADPVKSAEKEALSVSDAIASLKQMHRWTHVLPIGAAVERILEHTGYLALAGTSPEGVEAGDLLHAVDQVRQVVERGLGLPEAAASLDPEALASAEVESLPLEPGRPDVVRVMNLHKAKGLEADVVFLVDPCGGAAKHADVRIVRSGAEARGYFLLIRRKKGSWPRDVLGEPPGWAAHQAEEEKYLEAEEKRLLYVAATRARQVLVVGRWAKPTGGSRPWAMFNDHLAGVPELKVPADASVPATESVDVSGAVADAARAARDGKHEAVRAASWSASSEVLARARARRA